MTYTPKSGFVGTDSFTFIANDGLNDSSKATINITIEGDDTVNNAFEIPVVIVKYFPLNANNIDINVTGDWGESLSFTRGKTDRLTNEVINALEQGSRYHAYKNSGAEPSLKYNVVKTYEFLEPLNR